MGVGFQAHLVGHTGRHGHGGDAGGADDGVDRVVAEAVEQLGHEDAGGGADHEGHQAQHQDAQGFHDQELFRAEFRAHCQAQHDGHHVDQRIAGGIHQTADHTGFLHQVTQAEHAQQRRRIGQYQGHQHQQQDGEKNLFRLAHRAQLLHLDGAFLGGGQGANDGGLNDRHQGHVGIGRYGDGTEQFRGQLGGHVNGRGTVRAADDADGRRIRQGEVHTQEVQRQGPQQSRKDTELCCGAQQQGARVGQQWAEVGHGAHAHEDQQWEDAGHQAYGVDQVEDAIAVVGFLRQVVELVLYCRPGAFSGFIERFSPGIRVHAEHLGHAGEQILAAEVHGLADGGLRQPGHGDVGQQAAKADRQ